MSALEGEIRLVGDRLFLREFVFDDCSAVQSYAGDAEVTRFTDWGRWLRLCRCIGIRDRARSAALDRWHVYVPGR